MSPGLSGMDSPTYIFSLGFLEGERYLNRSCNKDLEQMKNFDFDRIFGNNSNSKSASKASKKRRGRQARIEELEGSDLFI